MVTHRVHKQTLNAECSEKHTPYQDKIEQCGLIHLHEIQVPGLDFVLRRSRLVVAGLLVIDMVLTILDHLGQNLAGDVGERNRMIHARVLDHVLHGL